LLLDVVLWHLTKNKTESVQCNLWKGSGQNFNAHRRSSSFGWEMVYTVKQVGRSPRQSELPFVVKGKKSSLSFEIKLEEKTIVKEIHYFNKSLLCVFYKRNS
jgi:hypothetical protein